MFQERKVTSCSSHLGCHRNQLCALYILQHVLSVPILCDGLLVLHSCKATCQQIRFETRWGGDFVTTIAVVLYIASLCFWKYDYSIWNVDGNILNADTCKFMTIAFRLLIGVVGIYVVKKLADVFVDYMQHHDNWFYQLILKTGKETMMFYIFQNALIFQLGIKVVAMISNRLGYNPFSFNHGFLGYVLAPVITILMLYTLLAFIRIMKKNKYSSKLFGFPQIRNYALNMVQKRKESASLVKRGHSASNVTIKTYKCPLPHHAT